jgi:hypothetical protein
MPGDIRLDIDLKGPFFSKHIDDETKHALYVEVLDKVDQRVMRQPRSPKLGRKNNTLESRRREAQGEVAQDIESTLNWPRTRGTSWVGYNMNAIRKLAPNVIRAAGRRIAAELGGS